MTSSTPSSPSPIAKAIDRVLEATIVGSFSTIGYRVRSSLLDWSTTDLDLTGTRMIVTGATSGIGKATADGLLSLGADVIITSRSQDRADAAAGELNDAPTHDTTRGEAIPETLDTGDFDSILAFADRVRLSREPIDALVNNAGALTDERRTDERDVELTLSTHLIGPYLLLNELRPQLRSGARVLFMSSGGMYSQELDVGSLEMSEDDYRGAVAYARAKRAQVELVAHLAPQWAPDVILHAVHPGWVDTDGLDAGLPGFSKIMGPVLRTAEEGADTMVWLAAGGASGAEPGQFWHDRAPRGTVYLPGTGTNSAERDKLVDWLDLMTLPAAVET